MSTRPRFTIRVPSIRALPKRLFSGKWRFLLPVLVVFIAKMAGAVWLYSRFSVSGRFPTELHTMYPPELPTRVDFFHIFINWDTAAYVDRSLGYPDEFSLNYAFMPGFPIVIRAFYLITGDLGASAVLPAFILGLASLPVLQAVAEGYMPRPEAMGCTLITAFFPIVFVYSTVAYSEPLFLLTSLASWYLYKRGKVLHAVLLVAVTAITRIYGVFMLAPIFLDLLFQRKWKLLPYTLIPPLALFGWFFYCFQKTGDWLASMNAQALFGVPGQEWLSKVVPFYSGQNVQFSAVFLTFVALVGLLFFLSCKYDWRLAAYPIITFLGIIAFAPMHSYIRFFSFLFPIWLNIRTKNPLLIAIVCVFFYLHGLMAWYHFHVGYLM